MLALAGSVPDDRFPLTEGEVEIKGGLLLVGGREVEINRGTPALAAAARQAADQAGGFPVYAYLVGDQGLGRGSRRLYEHLAQNLVARYHRVMVFHYLQPDVDWHNRVLFALEEMKPRPVLIADAGFMYAAKMSGQAPAYDLFTPDVGELAFLADETAPHPFYTRGFILHEEDRAEALIARAYAHRNAAAHLLVKGRTDIVAAGGQALHRIDRPAVEAMEAVGGTGDTLTGVAAALVASGMSVPDAAAVAARANRLAGQMAAMNPASRIIELIDRIPEALRVVMAVNDT